MGQQNLLEDRRVCSELTTRVNDSYVTLWFVQDIGAQFLVKFQDDPIEEGSHWQDKAILADDLHDNRVLPDMGASLYIAIALLFFLPRTSWISRTFLISTGLEGRASVLTLTTKRLTR